MSLNTPITNIEPGTGIAQYGSDKVFPRFYPGKVLNTAKSEQVGYPVYDPVDRVEVFIPGEKDVADHIVRPNSPYPQRWPVEWANYKASKEQRASGTPLELLFPDQPDVAMQLNSLHIHTIQQLASLTDTGVGNIPRGLHLVKTAQEYLNRASGQTDRINELQEQNEALMARLAALEAKATEAPKSRGWPKGKPRKPVEAEAPPMTEETADGPRS